MWYILLNDIQKDLLFPVAGLLGMEVNYNFEYLELINFCPKSYQTHKQHIYEYERDRVLNQEHIMKEVCLHVCLLSNGSKWKNPYIMTDITSIPFNTD